MNILIYDYNKRFKEGALIVRLFLYSFFAVLAKINNSSTEIKCLFCLIDFLV